MRTETARITLGGDGRPADGRSSRVRRACRTVVLLVPGADGGNVGGLLRVAGAGKDEAPPERGFVDCDAASCVRSEEDYFLASSAAASALSATPCILSAAALAASAVASAASAVASAAAA